MEKGKLQGMRALTTAIDEMPTEEVQQTLDCEELIKRYAEIQDITVDSAREEIGAPTAEEILKNIEVKTLQKIRENQPPMNRAQRRALKKKVGAKKYNEMDIVSDTAKKLACIDLIQKLRKLNEEKENNGEIIDEDD